MRKKIIEEHVDYEYEKGLHERAKRQLAELRLAKARGNVYDSAQVERVFVDLYTKFRVKLESLPHKLATQIEGKGRMEIDAILTQEIHDCLTEIATFDPELFKTELPDDEVDK